MKQEKKVFTSYSKAVKWLNGGLVLCNNIVDVDDSIWEHFTKDIYDEENESYTEIFQWFITNYSEDDVQWLTKNFDLLFTYSEKLDCYILAVDHYGTSWDYVACEVLTKEMKERIVESHLTYEELTK